MQVQHDSLLHSKSKVTFLVSNRYSRLWMIDKLFCFVFVCSDNEQTNLNEMLNNTQIRVMAVFLVYDNSNLEPYQWKKSCGILRSNKNLITQRKVKNRFTALFRGKRGLHNITMIISLFLSSSGKFTFVVALNCKTWWIWAVFGHFKISEEANKNKTQAVEGKAQQSGLCQ